ncbi:prolipoprotein diacylglyceryl transferase [Rubrobacter xylanophilus]|uniref:Phosphatidylglycerol--prolipoprotein diacylglyceryl transferase n=2 Tax=Rubrobacter xylanophilus TaxID=49319 RepID=A0A510HF82_9ACTN|nr:prolipoprotein diacylglyceryl transferase [Rubrobacter xylanophilus]
MLAGMLHTALISLPSPPSPVIFEAGPFALRYYGLFIALGILAATWVGSRELSRRGYDGTLALDSLFFIVPLGFVGARLYHVITDYELYASDPFPGVFEVWNGGLGIYGAVAGGALGAALFCWWRRVGFLDFADAAAPGLILAQAIGRWGNYFNQELFGRPSDLPWAIRIDPENRPPEYADATSFHPTFLYESLWNLLVFAALMWISRRFERRLRPGDVFILYVSLYSLGRFFVETLRVDPAFIIGEGFRGNLFVSSVLAIGFALLFFLRHSRPSRKNNTPS